MVPVTMVVVMMVVIVMMVIVGVAVSNRRSLEYLGSLYPADKEIGSIGIPGR